MNRKYSCPADLKIYFPKKDFLYQDKSLIVIDKKAQIKAIGAEAENYCLEEGEEAIFSPLKRGILVDFTPAEKLFRAFFEKASQLGNINWGVFGKRRMVYCVAPMSPIEFTAMMDALALSMRPGDTMIFHGTMEEFLQLPEGSPVEMGVYEIHKQKPFNYRLEKVKKRKNEYYDFLFEIAKDDPREYAEEMVEELRLYCNKHKITLGSCDSGWEPSR